MRLVKSIVVATALLFSCVSAYAENNESKQLELQCSSVEDLRINQFHGDITVSIDSEDNTADASFNVSLTRPLQNQVDVEADLTGQYKVIPEGRFGAQEVISVLVWDKEKDLSRSQLNINLPGAHTSYLVYQGVSYRSNCTLK